MSENHIHAADSQCSPHAHGHGHGVVGADGRRLGIAFLIIFGFMFVEIVGALISGSLALLADAGHMATDAAALLLALSASWLANTRRASDAWPFGLRRAQVLAGFVNGVALFALIGWLIWESVQRFRDPPEILTGYMLAVAIAGLLANLAAFAVLHGGNRKDINMRGALLHVVGDILGSVAAIIAALLIGVTGLLLFDPLLTLAVCVLLARAAVPLLTDASRVLLQGAPSSFASHEVIATLKSEIPAIRGVHNFKAWMLTPEEAQLAMHVSIDPGADSQQVLTRIKTILRERFDLAESTIQVENDRTCPDQTVYGDEPVTRPSSQRDPAEPEDLGEADRAEQFHGTGTC